MELKMLEQTDLFRRERVLEGNSCVLVEGPRWGDAEFYGRWLLAAAKAEAFWKEAFKDPTFKEEVKYVWDSYIPDFGIAAAAMTMRLRENFTTFVLDVDSENGNDFTMMAEMGFFAQDDPIYRMTLPSSLTLEKVKAAMLKYAKTEDDEFMLHPEYIVTTLPLAEATALQNRLRAMKEFQNGPNCTGGYLM
jgi:hypothetical protein